MKTWTFLSPSTTVDLQNPQTFGKVHAEARTVEWGGKPIMHHAGGVVLATSRDQSLGLFAARYLPQDVDLLGVVRRKLAVARDTTPTLDYKPKRR